MFAFNHIKEFRGIDDRSLIIVRQTSDIDFRILENSPNGSFVLTNTEWESVKSLNVLEAANLFYKFSITSENIKGKDDRELVRLSYLHKAADIVGALDHTLFKYNRGSYVIEEFERKFKSLRLILENVREDLFEEICIPDINEIRKEPWLLKEFACKLVFKLMPRIDSQVLQANLGSEQADRFKFRHELASKFGGNLVGLAVYGSSVTSNSIEEIGDFDTYVYVNNLAQAYKKASSFRLKCHGKDVNLHLLEQTSAAQYLLGQSGPWTSPSAMLPIFGEVTVPIVPKDIVETIGWIKVTKLLLTHRERIAQILRYEDDDTRFFSRLKSIPELRRNILEAPSVLALWAYLYPYDTNTNFPPPKATIRSFLRLHDFPDLNAFSSDREFIRIIKQSYLATGRIIDSILMGKASKSCKTLLGL